MFADLLWISHARHAAKSTARTTAHPKPGIPEETAMTETLERNKQNVVAFYDLMFNQDQPTQAASWYVGTSCGPCPVSDTESPQLSS